VPVRPTAAETMTSFGMPWVVVRAAMRYRNVGFASPRYSVWKARVVEQPVDLLALNGPME